MNQAWWSCRLSDVAGHTPAPKAGTDRRTPFEQDRARVLHSRAFRRLQAKTQVFAPQQRDFYRTRLTHSLECSQIGKALALNLWPEAGLSGADLVEAACLAHDIGHPPFGHRGEAVLQELTGAFEGNAQTIRVLVRLEEKTRGFGLDLTRGTLASVIKYPFRQAPHRKKFIYDDDAEEFIERYVFDGSGFGLATDDSIPTPRPFPLLLMEWADDVAYSTHDLEDGINGGFISRAHLEDPFIFAAICAEVLKGAAKLGIEADQKEVEQLRRQLVKELGDRVDPPAALVKRVADARIHRLVSGVSRKPTQFKGDWLYSHKLVVPRKLRLECEFLKTVAREYVFRDSRVTRLEFKGENAVRFLFQQLLQDAKSAKPQLLTRAWRREFKKGHEAAFPRIVCDYVASMSDVFCLQLYAELTDPSVGSAFVSA